MLITDQCPSLLTLRRPLTVFNSQEHKGDFVEDSLKENVLSFTSSQAVGDRS